MQGTKTLKVPSRGLKVGEVEKVGGLVPDYRRSDSGASQSSAGAFLSRSNSYNFNDNGGAAAPEAALRAQNIELRRTLSRREQELEQTYLDLESRQKLLRSAAGEARREVLALRQQQEVSSAQLHKSQKQIEELNKELAQLREQAWAAEEERKHSPSSESSLAEWGGEDLRMALGAKERELEGLRADARVYAASKDALTAQIGELVAQVSALERGRKDMGELLEKIAALEEEVEKRKASEAELQTNLTALQQEHEQVTMRAEMLENELMVLREESTEDRLAGALRQLQLEQQCEQLEKDFSQDVDSRDQEHSSSETQGSDQGSKVNGLQLLLRPSQPKQGVHSPDRLARRVDFREVADEGGADRLRALAEEGGCHISAIRGEEEAHSGLDSTRPKRSQEQLTAELAAAAVYLYSLSADLNPERKLSEFRMVKGQDLGMAVEEFQGAMQALQEALVSRDLTEILEQPEVGGTAGALEFSRQSSSRPPKRTHGNKGRWVQRLLGGVILVPAFAAAAAFLPSRS